MNISRRNRTILATIFTIVFSVTAFFVLWYTVIKPAFAFNSSSTTLTSVGELLKNKNSAASSQPFDVANLTKLVNMISGSSGDLYSQVTSLTTSTATTPLTAAALRSKTYQKSSGNSIVVRIGGLDWIVTYVANDGSGNLVATLWLSSSYQEAWSGKNGNLGAYYGFSNGGLYSEWSAGWYSASNTVNYPSNMYGTSYIRTETLNNPTNRVYATSDGAETTAAVSQKTTVSAHPFALFTVEALGLTKYIRTPNDIEWQINLQNPAGRGNNSYYLNNESVSNSNNKYNYTNSWYGSTEYSGKTGYANWGADYLWLPSWAETGQASGATGIWDTNDAERSNYDGSTAQVTASAATNLGSSVTDATAYPWTWTRTANYDYSYAFTSYSLNTAGGSCTPYYVSQSRAVRPAFHLNLSMAASSTSYARVGELLQDVSSAAGTAPFSYNNVVSLVNMIQGSSGDVTTQANTLKQSVASAPINSQTLRSKTYNKSAGQSIVVRLGGLDWIVTYVSNNTDGDLIATLWLSNHHQEKWSGKDQNLGDFYGFVKGGLYSDWSGDCYSDDVGDYPNNVYGTSYIRVETLNNPNNRSYTRIEYMVNSATPETTRLNHPLGLYTMSDLGLTRFIETPSHIKWQNNLQNPALRGESDYYLSNESLSNTSNAYNYSKTWKSSTYNYQSKANYTYWAEDYLWLPSWAEIGNDDAANGLWGINTPERSTNDGYTETYSVDFGQLGLANNFGNFAYSFQWTRSAGVDNSSGSYSIKVKGFDNIYANNSLSMAVRPAMHINLSKIVDTLAQKITFDKQNGAGGTDELSLYTGDTMPSIVVPTRTGFYFDGYYTTVNGGGTKIYNEDGTPAIATSTFTGDTTLYAKWSAYSYTLDYDANGGVLSGLPKLINAGEAYGTLATATRAGYSFVNWYSYVGVSSSITNYDSIKRVSFLGNSIWAMTKEGDVGKALKVVMSYKGSFERVQFNDQNLVAWQYSASAQGDRNILTVEMILEDKHLGATSSNNFGTTYRFIDIEGASSLTDLVVLEAYVGTPVTSTTIVTTSSDHTLFAAWTAQTYKIAMNDSSFEALLTAEVGGFENTGWSNVTYDTTHVRSGSSAVKVTSTTSLNEKYICTSASYSLNTDNKAHIFYVQYWGYQETKTSNGSTQFYWPGEEPSMSPTSIALGEAGKWNRYSYYGSRATNKLGTSTQPFRIDFDNKKVAGEIWWDDLGVYDLTLIFGAGNEPTKAWCDTFINTGYTLQTVTYDVASNLTAHNTNLSLANHTFAGWSTTPRTTTTWQAVEYSDKQSVKSLASSGIANLYAVYRGNNMTITLKSNIDDAVGLLDGGGTFAYYTTTKLRAFATGEYAFVNWLKDGAAFSGNTTNEISVTITANATYTAVFKKVISKADGPIMRVECQNDSSASAYGFVGCEIITQNSQIVAHITAVCADGYTFVGWKISGVLSTTYITEEAYVPYSEVNGKDVCAVFNKN